ncbi:MAG TPA: glycine/sarcosine/betaine reductase complex component C subunit beta [Candidatus Micrarchaeaceae archaeon]|nr:glycine/sarcosine/betaine reductase complex component C subunit beta [Candidatus Micrarchaeaceae archaeon]
MRRAAVLAAAVTLQHAPQLVRYGSKPAREVERLPALTASLRSFSEAVAYPPHQVFIGNRRPEELWEMARPWWDSAASAATPAGRNGEILPQSGLYALMEEVDQFGLIRLGDTRELGEGELPLFAGEERVGVFGRAHDLDAELQAPVLLENLACKAGGVHALRWLLARKDLDPTSIDYTIGCGEEAVGDRYQRGGGALGKAIAEASGLVNSGGSDIKAFCAAPVHALVQAGALVQSGVYERVAVVAGGSLAKLGMKFLGALEHGAPVLEDVLAGLAVIVGAERDDGPVLRLDAVGRHRTGSGSSQQALLEDIVVRPLERMGRRFTDIDRYATELHDPEITEPAGGGDVPDRNYRMLAGMAVLRGEISREEIGAFVREHGLPGFAPTQGHMASAVPWLPHALDRFRSGELRSTMLLAKGSLFLGRMTRLWDGVSVTMEV